MLRFRAQATTPERGHAIFTRHSENGQALTAVEFSAACDPSLDAEQTTNLYNDVANTDGVVEEEIVA